MGACRRGLCVVVVVVGCGDNLGVRDDGSILDIDAQLRDAGRDTNVPTDATVVIDAPDASTPPDAGSSTDTTPPTILSVTPASAATGVWLHDRFAVTFSEPIAPATITTQTLRLLDVANQNISGEVAVATGGTVAYVRALDTAAMIGQLRLEVGTGVTDVAGNALASPSTFMWNLAPWAKPAAGLTVGATPQSPAVNIANDTIWLATSVAVTGGRRIVVTDSAGIAIGAPLGTGTAITPVVAGSVVAWANSATQTIEAARWDGSAWVAVPSPGSGSMPALAASPSGAVGIVWVNTQNDLAAALLVNAAWQPMAGTPLAAAAITSEPALAMPSDTSLVTAFVERVGTADRVRVATLAAAVTERPALTLAALPPTSTQHRVSVAARTTAIVVGWDEYSGHSFSAHVAVAAGPGWTILPALDVDPPGNTLAPSVQLDAAGSPVAAWVERVEGRHRGFVARWSGTAWVTIGGDAWTNAPTLAPVRPALRLFRDRVPVVAWVDTGATTIGLARFNGPGTPKFGIAARAPLTGCTFDPASPPATLSATGCFTIANGVATPHAGLVPYDLRSELWSDGALKRRWIGVPTGALTTLANGSLEAPVGSFLIKEFAINDPATRTIMETRFLARDATGWRGFSYRWRMDGTDADLLAGNSSLTVGWPLTSGGTHSHIYPSRTQCQRCHNTSVGQLLGVRPEQLARRFDYNGVLDDQLRTFAQIGLYTAAANVTPMPAPHDPRTPLALRVRGYIASNCSHCHNPAGERPQQDFRLATPLASTGLCDLLVPGDSAGSRIYQRISQRPGMPPIASDLTDPLIVDVMAAWIRSVTTCP